MRCAFYLMYMFLLGVNFLAATATPKLWPDSSLIVNSELAIGDMCCYSEDNFAFYGTCVYPDYISVGTSGINEDASFALYPIPAHYNIFIDLGTAQHAATITIMNLRGTVQSMEQF